MATETTPIPTMEITSTRVFPVSPGHLFEMFRNPEHLIHWWGPAGFTNTFHEFDFRPGGKWRFTMHGPDGAYYPNEKTFVETAEAERIVFDHFQPMHLFRMTMSYEPAENGQATRLTWQMVFNDGPANEKFREFITVANEQNFDRLEGYLKSLDS